uniref:Carboxylic ester hydrolase n=1 Tax=Streltzoviella insularis TaxID=1206366 RepID=A0A7D5UMP8_9NEOP|nr:carboxylesterase 4 [Streltzoviella insularis]
MSSPIVDLNEGKLKGKVCKTLNKIQYYSFKGVPYAKPPLGELRFSVPVPSEPWKGIRDATKNCNICAQFDRDTNGIIGDEDCLYLNVYTPKLSTTNSTLLPVMVYIHGGGFVFGSGTDDVIHGPDYLVEKDVVLVSLNYRLGVLGFLSLDCKEAPGNVGLRDQVEALRWVQKNINKFGGDPKNVTIFGASAGAASVEYLLLSPIAKGLFHKALAQSGSSLLHWAQTNKAKEFATKIASLKGKVLQDNQQLLTFLKSLPIKDLIATSMLVLAADTGRGGINFGFVPTIENPVDWEPFIDKSPYELLSRGEFTKVPFVSGFCTREGLLMVARGENVLNKLVKEKDFIEYLPFEIDSSQHTELENKIKHIYLDGKNKYQDEDAFAIDFFTDVDFLGGVYVATTLIAKHNSPVYFYEFCYDGNLNYLKNKLNINRQGACHGDENGYLIKSDKYTKGQPSETDKLVRERMAEMWTNFARHGDPTPKTDSKVITTKWEPLAETGMTCLLIDDKLTMQDNVYPARMKLFESLYKNAYASE